MTSSLPKINNNHSGGGGGVIVVMVVIFPLVCCEESHMPPLCFCSKRVFSFLEYPFTIAHGKSE